MDNKWTTSGQRADNERTHLKKIIIQEMKKGDFSMTLFDASAYLYYDQSQMDRTRPLWFVRDCSEVDCLVSNAVALLPDADIRACAPFLRAFPSVFVAIADEKLAEITASMLTESVLALTVLKPKQGAFGSAKSVREVLEVGGLLAVD